MLSGDQISYNNICCGTKFQKNQSGIFDRKFRDFLPESDDRNRISYVKLKKPTVTKPLKFHANIQLVV